MFQVYKVSKVTLVLMIQKHILNRYIYDFNVDDEAFSTDLIETINTFPQKKDVVNRCFYFTYLPKKFDFEIGDFINFYIDKL